MDEDYYDEFGNYIGPDVEEEEEQDQQQWGYDEYAQQEAPMEDYDAGFTNMESDAMLATAVVDYDPNNRVVLAEDKQYYPDAAELYPDVEVLVQDEDTQPLSQPVIAPTQDRKFLLYGEPPQTTFDFKFLTGLMDHPIFTRHVAVVGQLHHGKTSLVDMLVQYSHPNVKKSKGSDGVRYTDARVDEQARQISLKSTPISLVLPTLANKHHLINVMDTPGHLDCSAEVTAALRVVDGVILVVDAVEGVMLGTEKVIQQLCQADLNVVLCITKIDRLILESKLPPSDAYLKLNHIVEEVNALLIQHSLHPDKTRRVSAVEGSVLFSSAKHHWCFTLSSFAHTYAQYHGGFDAVKFSRRLWGDVYLHSNRKFATKGETGSSVRTFVQFILEPLYKMYAHTLGTDAQDFAALCADVGVKVSAQELRLDAKALLVLILSRFFADSVECMTDSITTVIPSPIRNAQHKVENTYTGNMKSILGKGMIDCDPQAPLMMDVVKSYPSPDAKHFNTFARVLSGTARVGDKVRVLGPRYKDGDEEDMSVREISRIWVMQGGRYSIEVNRVTAGNWAVFEGIDAAITKTATVTALTGGEDAAIFKPLPFINSPNVKIAVEPDVPSELPRMTEALRSICKCYPLVETKVEESGEHVILACGELEMDCVLHDLREVYGRIIIKVSDPCVAFAETVAESSVMKCFAETPNKQNRLTILAECLEESVINDIQQNHLSLSTPNLSTRMQQLHNWDVLAARSIWAFGETESNCNILCDDTLGVDKDALDSIREGMCEGFNWAVREGPLCEQPIRNVKFRVLDAVIADEPLQRARRQIIPTTRRAIYSAFLMAAPRLMEPVNIVEVMAPSDCLPTISKVLTSRRGYTVSTAPKAGTPLSIVNAHIPVIETFGFETDLRSLTNGMASMTMLFHHWDVVPGDPLDKSIVIKPLQIAPRMHLARDFMLKTRRRKGLSEDVNVNRFFDEDMLLELAKYQSEEGQY